jgi:uncharacterized membrane protein
MIEQFKINMFQEESMSDQNDKSAPATGLPENVALLIAYLFSWLGGLIILLTAAANNKKLKFHALQSIFLGIAIVIASIVLNIIINIVPFLWFLSSIFSLCAVAACICLGFFAYQGRTWELPVIADIARPMAEK